jgi:hypothetical protein
MEARFLFIIGEGEERAVYTHFCRKLRDKKHQLKNCKAMVAGKAALADSTAHLARCAGGNATGDDSGAAQPRRGPRQAPRRAESTRRGYRGPPKLMRQVASPRVDMESPLPALRSFSRAVLGPTRRRPVPIGSPRGRRHRARETADPRGSTRRACSGAGWTRGSCTHRRTSPSDA